MSIKIITDSAADLPREIIDKYNIRVIPIYVFLNGKEFLDGETLKADTLYKDMRNGKIYKTAQITPETFKKVFIEYAKNDEECIYIAFSSGLSGTYQASIIAKEEVLEEYPNFKLDIIDTKCASLGFGLVVYRAALMLEQGKSRKEIVEAIKFYSEHTEHIFTVDNLEYLYRGGRVSKTSAFIGGVLNIKPILDVEDGRLVPIEKVRGRKKALKQLVEMAQERGINLKHQIIGISHGDCLEEALIVKDMMIKKFDCKEFIINNITRCAS
ncbi:DegV family protein [Defluviitalea phaphyphila]|uniref:DegV family protein n=1 Tax=Defluviitalea phaphyphila TaxID=1473580 RepID=UPI0007304343|nr:DegV family protein [Defluviitalea phaphyphila]